MNNLLPPTWDPRRWQWWVLSVAETLVLVRFSLQWWQVLLVWVPIVIAESWLFGLLKRATA